jgi:hypothetical protein
MRWLMCLRANNLVAIAVLMLLFQRESHRVILYHPWISACTLEQCFLVVSAMTVRPPKM